ncbi:MAG: hypothetical protein IJ088_14315 [Clostridia bacterium]|nr:hypothetical protein [Clostridia bacterium]
MRSVFLVICLCLLTVLTGVAAADLNVVQTSCNILVAEEECRIVCCAQVHNDSDRLAGLEHGLLRLTNGGEVIAEESVSRIWPYFLDPGGDGYVFETVTFYPDEDGNLEVPSITGVSFEMNAMDVPVSVENNMLRAEMHIERMETGGYIMACTLANDEAETAWNPQVTFGLYTDGGSLLYADGQSLDNIGISGGNQLELRFMINPQIVAQWGGYGVEPAEVRVKGYYRQESD